MISLLLDAYPRHFSISRQIQAVQIQHITTASGRFELSDKVSTGVCPQGTGVAVFLNPNNRAIEIVNVEKYIDLFAGTRAGGGRKCDFLLYDSEEKLSFFCAELTNSAARYIEPYLNREGPQMGKRAYAVTQLTETINKLLSVPEIKIWIGNFKHIAGIFSYRLTDETGTSDPVAQMNRAFNRFSEEVPALQTEGLLPCGFVFRQRKYPESCVI